MAKKKDAKPKKLKVNKETVRKGALADADADKVAGGQRIGCGNTATDTCR